MMSEAIVILMNMRGGCVTIGEKVHVLFRVNGRRNLIKPAERTEPEEAKAGQTQ